MASQHLHLDILPQPNDTTCGPTCLHAVYRYFGDEMPLAQVIAEVTALEEGGTLAVLLGQHALQRGYRATIYTYNLNVFDPTWFGHSPTGSPEGESALEPEGLVRKLASQTKRKQSKRLNAASQAYMQFLNSGGRIRMQDLNAALFRKYLDQATPVLTGLSSTYLYQHMRERMDGTDDDVGGVPMGHFVVLAGYDKKAKTVRVADPYELNPMGGKHYYAVKLDRLICAVLLGVLTYDANLLIIEPPS